MANTVLTVRQGESKYIKWTVTTSAGVPVDVSGVTAAAIAYKKTVRLFTIANASFDKSGGSSGILRALGTFATAGIWELSLTMTFVSSGIVDISKATLIVIPEDPPAVVP